MIKLIVFVAFCLVAGLQAMPASEEHDPTVVIPKEAYDKSFIKYKSEHDIVDVMVPLNAINFVDNIPDGSPESDENIITGTTCFFVEADGNSGNREYKGLYRFKNDKTKMILQTGRTSAASRIDNKLVFFGASDGLYVYNVDTDSADKYGAFTDSIKSMATDGTGKTIYILTDDHKLYKVTNNGETKELLDNIADAQEIVVDDEDNLYYYTSKNELYIKTAEKIIKVENLPAEPKTIKLIRPPFIMSESIPILCDNTVYVVSSNGSAERFDIQFSAEASPTAVGVESVFMQYYGHGKKLYEFNLMALRDTVIFDSIKDKTENVRTQANKKKHMLGAKRV